MSKDWFKDINDMHKHYGTHEAMAKMDADKLRKFLEFRANFLQEELDELRTAESAEDLSELNRVFNPSVADRYVHLVYHPNGKSIIGLEIVTLAHNRQNG